ncbi:hypothetical protein [Phosphitispora sp. TUW77]|uniref:hypothetical protein n=1 Tax=Phosphitispora sp. TUW77 TaxID=3152361 RepID=UPI003AB79000
MIIATDFLIAMRCPLCGKLDFHSISRFAFVGVKNIKITCACGAPKLIIGTKNCRQFWLQVPCMLCETNHLVYYKAKQLWANKVEFFYCNDTNVELGFFGPEEKVYALAEKYEYGLESLFDGLGYDDYFYNPEIMFEVLNCLHDVAEEGFLYCECGSSQIEIDIFPDRVELNCKDCKSIRAVYAENDEDLIKIKDTPKIVLVDNGLKLLKKLSKAKKGKRRSLKPAKD